LGGPASKQHPDQNATKGGGECCWDGLDKKRPEVQSGQLGVILWKLCVV
jgi:hypothetical protein